MLIGAYFAVPVRSEATASLAARVVIVTLLFILLGAAVASQVRSSADPANTRIDGLIIAMALVWVSFAIGLYALAIHEPHQVEGLKTRVDALYFVGSTVLTIGYGDIHASGQAARVVVVAQMVFNVVFVATAASILGDHVRRRAADRAAERRSNR